LSSKKPTGVKTSVGISAIVSMVFAEQMQNSRTAGAIH